MLEGSYGAHYGSLSDGGPTVKSGHTLRLNIGTGHTRKTKDFLTPGGERGLQVDPKTRSTTWTIKNYYAYNGVPIKTSKLQ